MTKKKTKKKTSKTNKQKFCPKCGFHELYCPDHGCGSFERVDEKIVWKNRYEAEEKRVKGQVILYNAYLKGYYIQDRRKNKTLWNN